MLTLHPSLLAAVVTEALRSAAEHPRWVSAINKAAVELAENPWIEALDDHTLLMGSSSGRAYVGNGTCQCTAFTGLDDNGKRVHAGNQPCWHRAAAHLYHRYVEAESKQSAPATEHISVQARKAYAAANGPRRPLYAERDAETMRRQALGEERAVLEEMRRKRKLAAERATALLNETFAQRG